MNDDMAKLGATGNVETGSAETGGAETGRAEAGRPETGDRDVGGADSGFGGAGGDDRTGDAGGGGSRRHSGGGQARTVRARGSAEAPGERDRSVADKSRSGQSRRLVVLTAPSGGGKTTVARRVMASVPELRFSVSATTRPPRSHERHGVDYYFVSPEEFRQYVESGDLLEYEEVYPGVYYGTLRDEVERRAAESPILLDIDVRGAQAVKRIYGDDVLVIFIRPPSFEVLESRLLGRATEDLEARKTRLERARLELEFSDRFDAVVVNDDVEKAVAETLDIIREFLNG